MELCSLNINDILQGAGVILALALCIGWIFRSIFLRRNRKGGCCSDGNYWKEEDECRECPLSNNCKKH